MHLIRRSIADGEYAFYRAHAPGPVPLAQLVKVAGSRWKIEDGFAASKELAALDEHQVRSWTSWHRWTILALLAHAFLAVLAAARADDQNPDDDQLIPLTCNEIRGSSPGCASSRPHPEYSCTGPDGDAATNTPPEPATTGNKTALAQIT